MRLVVAIRLLRVRRAVELHAAAAAAKWLPPEKSEEECQRSFAPRAAYIRGATLGAEQAFWIWFGPAHNLPVSFGEYHGPETLAFFGVPSYKRIWRVPRIESFF